jgi:ectoine hydroxylase-related dioxygenase (phytanoyl-CoA dioxygenase family)
VKDRQSPPLWWHQDWWCWSHPISFARQAAQVAVLCYLDATDERSGALRFLPGSHRHSVGLHAVLPAAHAQGKVGLEHAAMLDDPEQLTFDAEPGDAIVIDYRLLHGTHPNELPRRRSCLILNFAPAWAELPTEIKAHLIRHPAQPSADEHPPVGLQALLPSFAGERRDLPLARDAPVRFAIA